MYLHRHLCSAHRQLQRLGMKTHSHIRNVPGGAMSAIISCMVYTYHGQRTPMPGNGRPVPMSLAGMSPADQPLALLSTCSPGYKAHMAWVTLGWSSRS